MELEDNSRHESSNGSLNSLKFKIQYSTFIVKMDISDILKDADLLSNLLKC